MGQIDQGEPARPAAKPLHLQFQAASLLGMNGPYPPDQIPHLAPGLQNHGLAVPIELEIPGAERQRILAWFHQNRLAAGLQKTLDRKVSFRQSVIDHDD